MIRVIFTCATLFVFCLSTAVSQTFEELDLDDNGVITKEEFERAKTKKKSHTLSAVSSKSVEAAPAAKSPGYDVDGANESPASDSFFDNLEDLITLRRSFTTPDGFDDPARFAWNKAAGQEFYAVDGAVAIRGLGGSEDHFDWEISPVFEAHITDEEGKFRDSQSFRMPVEFIYEVGKAEVITRVAALWETDRTKDVEALGGDVYFSFNYGAKNDPSIQNSILRFLGARDQIGDSQYHFRFRPWMGLEGGEYRDDGGAAEILGVDDYFRFAPGISAELWVAERMKISSSYIYRLDVVNNDSFGYFDSSLMYFFDTDERFSVGFTYEYGRSTPQFKKVDALSAWLGIKF